MVLKNNIFLMIAFLCDFFVVVGILMNIDFDIAEKYYIYF